MPASQVAFNMVSPDGYSCEARQSLSVWQNIAAYPSHGGDAVLYRDEVESLHQSLWTATRWANDVARVVRIHQSAPAHLPYEEGGGQSIETRDKASIAAMAAGGYPSRSGQMRAYRAGGLERPLHQSLPAR